MFKYLLLVQVLFANEFYGFELFPDMFGEQSRTYDTESLNYPIFEIKERYFDYQKLNHLDPADQRIWRQRYFVNDTFHKTGGPVFLMMDRYSPEYMITYGAWIKYAEQLGAMCVFVEHRFFGYSVPTVDLSTENLRYLTSQQALGDAANIIEYINMLYRLNKDTKWIAFGGGYEGSLAAWLRLKYPHLVHGAVSSSAHLRPAIEYSDYYGIVGYTFGKHNPECKAAIKDAFSELDTLLQHPDGQQKAKEILKIEVIPYEEPEFKALDISYLFARIASFFARALPGHKYNESYIASICNIMTNKELGTPLERVSNFLYGKYAYLRLHSNAYNMFLRYIRSTTIDHFGTRQDLYQQCTEFGLFTTSDNPEHVFGNRFPKDYFKRLCSDAFGPDYYWNELEYLAPTRQELEYGGENLNVTNVVFVQGTYDPMLPLGILKEPNPTSPVILIEGASRADDIYGESDDSSQLKEAREKIVNYIGAMLEK